VNDVQVGAKPILQGDEKMKESVNDGENEKI
jgi:hypothetical protein